MGAKKKGLANRLAKMSDEDRARYLQHRADIEEEARRRKEQLISIFLKNKLKKEEAFSRLNVAKINQNWHQIMRRQKCKLMKEDVQNMKSQMERVIDLKNRTIKRLIKELDEAEDQYGNNFQSHLNHITNMIDFGYKSLEEMHETYDKDREEILEEAKKDRRGFLKKALEETVYLKTLIHQNGESSKKELRENYEYYFKRSDDVIRQNKEEFEMMRQEKESTIGDLWRKIANFLRDHVEATDVKRAHLAELQSLDAESAAEIAKNEEIIKRQEEEIEALERQFEDSKKSRSEEIKQLTEITRKVKREHLEAKIHLKKDLDADEKRFIFLTATSNDTIRHLEKLKEKGVKLLQLMQICRKYETQEEKILRFSTDAELEKYTNVDDNGDDNGNGGPFKGNGKNAKPGDNGNGKTEESTCGFDKSDTVKRTPDLNSFRTDQSSEGNNAAEECIDKIFKDQSSEDKSLLSARTSLKDQSSEINNIFDSRQKRQSSEDNSLYSAPKIIKDKSSPINKRFNTKQIIKEDKKLHSAHKLRREQSFEITETVDSKLIFQGCHTLEDTSLLSAQNIKESSEINKRQAQSLEGDSFHTSHEIEEMKQISQESQENIIMYAIEDSQHNIVEDQSTEINNSGKISSEGKLPEDTSMHSKEDVNSLGNYEQQRSYSKTKSSESVNEVSAQIKTPTIQPKIISHSRSSSSKPVMKSHDSTTESKKFGNESADALQTDSYDMKAEIESIEKSSNNFTKSETAGEEIESKNLGDNESSEDRSTNAKPKLSRKFSEIKAELEKHLSCEESSLKMLESNLQSKLQIGRSVRDKLLEIYHRGKSLGAKDLHHEEEHSSSSIQQLDETEGHQECSLIKSKQATVHTRSSNDLDQTDIQELQQVEKPSKSPATFNKLDESKTSYGTKPTSIKDENICSNSQIRPKNSKDRFRAKSSPIADIRQHQKLTECPKYFRHSSAPSSRLGDVPAVKISRSISLNPGEHYRLLKSFRDSTKSLVSFLDSNPVVEISPLIIGTRGFDSFKKCSPHPNSKHEEELSSKSSIEKTLVVENSKQCEVLSKDFKISSPPVLDVEGYKHGEDSDTSAQKLSKTSEDLRKLSKDVVTSSIENPVTLAVENYKQCEGLSKDFAIPPSQLVLDVEGYKHDKDADTSVQKLFDISKDLRRLSKDVVTSSIEKSTTLVVENSKQCEGSSKDIGISPSQLVLDVKGSKHGEDGDVPVQKSSKISRSVSFMSDEHDISKHLSTPSPDAIKFERLSTPSKTTTFTHEERSIGLHSFKRKSLFAEKESLHENSPIVIDISKNMRNQRLPISCKSSKISPDVKKSSPLFLDVCQNIRSVSCKISKKSPLILGDQHPHAISKKSSSSSSIDDDVSKSTHALSSKQSRRFKEEKLQCDGNVSKKVPRHKSSKIVDAPKNTPIHRLSKSSKHSRISRFNIKDLKNPSSPSSDGNSSRSNDSKPPAGEDRRLSKTSKGSRTPSSSSLDANPKVHVMVDCFGAVKKLEGLWNAYNKVLINCKEMRKERKCLLEENEHLKGVMRTILEAAVLEKISFKLEQGSNEEFVRNIHSADAVYKSYNVKVLD